MSQHFAIEATVTIPNYELGFAIEDKIDSVGAFTTVTTVKPGRIISKGLVLISVQPMMYAREPYAFTHIGLFKKGARVATGQARLSFTEVHRIKNTSFTDIIDRLPPKLRKHARLSFGRDYGSIPPNTAKEIYKAILELCPNEAEFIASLAKRWSTGKQIRRMERPDLLLEKDAVATCLDIFGIDRANVLGSWNIDAATAGSSYLNGLEEYYVYEDDIISHDLHTLPGWSVLNQSITGVVEFKNNQDERMIIINANRKPIEEAMGVDLIYYNQKYHAYTFLQYKMMDKPKDSMEFYYRPKGSTYQQEHKKMGTLFSAIVENNTSHSLKDYRFAACPIFFKLCKRIQFLNDKNEIAHGAYIALNHWNYLLEDGSMKGAKGGIQIGFHTLGKRYICKNLFVELIQKGLVGSSGLSSTLVERFIKAALTQGHNVMFAFDESTAKGR